MSASELAQGFNAGVRAALELPPLLPPQSKGCRTSRRAAGIRQRGSESVFGSRDGIATRQARERSGNL